jgi:putative endonuclease
MGDDLAKRISEHETGACAGYTWSRRPVTLVWHEHFDRITDAIVVERQIKGWCRRKKQAMIRGYWRTVESFSRRRAGRAKSASPS